MGWMSADWSVLPVPDPVAGNSEEGAVYIGLRAPILAFGPS